MADGRRRDGFPSRLVCTLVSAKLQWRAAAIKPLMQGKRHTADGSERCSSAAAPVGGITHLQACL